MTRRNFRTFGLAIVAALVGLSVGGTAEAQMPIPTAQTPGMIGGQTIGSGNFVLGASTGFPETRFHAIWGLGNNFDLGIQPGITYGGWGRGRGRNSVSSLRQNVGLDMQVPLRFTVAHMQRAAVGIRVSPFFRIGESSPAISVGSLIGARFSIALPKLFTLVVGPEARFAFAHVGESGDAGFNFFDGAVYAVTGLETYFKNKWYFNFQMDIGGYFGSNNAWNGALVNAYFGFGVEL